ncbi:hypothetical protein PAPHI01_2148 [Pancytospora philotis]|nr:hypothetical protein PAPHI01_2148 [Pancytospora philotis]
MATDLRRNSRAARRKAAERESTAGATADEHDEHNEQTPESEADNATRVMDSGFDYEKYCQMVADMDLDVFFAHCRMPAFEPYPDVFAIKNEYIAMNDKLFKKAKEQEEVRRQNSLGRPADVRLRKAYLDVFDPKKKPTPEQERRVARGVRMYCHSEAVASLFSGFYTLVDYHRYALSMHPALKKAYCRAIFAIFGSLGRKAVLEMLGELCTTRKMFGFYKTMYETWRSECDRTEKEVFFSSP